MLKFRMLLLVSMLMSTLAANAQNAAPSSTSEPPAKNPPPEKFAEQKQKDLTRIAFHLKAMQALQTCVQASNDKPALKACHETARATMKNRK